MTNPRTKQAYLTGKLFVISAPSGCGKTTLGKKLLKGGLGLKPSVSMTTRPPRPDETDGVDYRFVSQKTFLGMAKKKGFLEHEENFGHSYGTPRQPVEDNLKKGSSVLLSIDVKGAMKVRKSYPKDSVLIFIMPPSIRDLKKRLESRRSDDFDSISTRLGLARKEMSYKGKYDYIVINDRLPRAYKRLRRIIEAELKKEDPDFDRAKSGHV